MCVCQAVRAISADSFVCRLKSKVPMARISRFSIRGFRYGIIFLPQKPPALLNRSEFVHSTAQGYKQSNRTPNTTWNMSGYNVASLSFPSFLGILLYFPYIT